MYEYEIGLITKKPVKCESDSPTEASVKISGLL